MMDTPRDRPFILCAWHNRIIYALFATRDVIQPKTGRKVVAMVSASKDGAVLARYMEHLGERPVRGSSSRRGARALLDALPEILPRCPTAATSAPTGASATPACRARTPTGP